jgi:hypothetical protein
MRNVYKILVGKPERKRPVGSSIHRREDIRIDLRGTEWETVDWMKVVQDRDGWRSLVKTIMNLHVPQKAGNFLTE